MDVTECVTSQFKKVTEKLKIKTRAISRQAGYDAGSAIAASGKNF
ncbi:hypothetical protein BN137_3423 [Cronobacter condimenti 1330]|uniref:Uncharacterized protein n=1 Tax=Cronobacter condimenti 1330 TaxID=1073999 RepID=K8A3G6_9ENTR|nr:hypothetical protein BN137_3423 [Cronobacter condimenti 1330]